jgi:hypothetical protein
MITQIENLPNNVIGLIYGQNITAHDYETVVFPVIKNATKDQKKIRIIFQLNNDFDHMSMKAMVDDAFVGLEYFNKWERIAIVSDNKGINNIIKAMRFLLPGDVMIFPLSEFDSAKEWISKD